MVKEGRGRELMLMPGWWYAISAASFLRTASPETPDTLALAREVKCPSLFVRGDQEPRDAYPAEEFRARAGGPCTVEIVPDCDHFYNAARRRSARWSRHGCAGSCISSRLRLRMVRTERKP